MRRAPEPRERRAKLLYMAPVCAVHQRDGAALDLEAYVAAGDVGHNDATLRDLVFTTRQPNDEAALIRHGRDRDHEAQRSPAAGGRVAIRPPRSHQIRSNRSQRVAFPHAVGRPTIHEKWVHDAVVPYVARAQAAMRSSGIANAPMTISRLRV